MRISETWSYEAGPDKVWAMITDPTFQERKCAASGALDYNASVTPQGEGATVVVSRTMPADDLPSQMRSFLKDGLVIVETLTWEGADAAGNRSGKVHLAIKGTPAAMKGTLKMSGSGGSTTLSMDADLRAGVPLLGGQIEKAAAPWVSEGVRVEAEVGRAYLAD